MIISIVHNLIALPGAPMSKLQVVESHPVALAQCERFFIAHPGLKRVAAEDTAGSVREMMNLADPARAAIASKRAAEIYGGEILQEHLEDDRENYTRFLLLALSTTANPTLDSAGHSIEKLSLVFELAHLPGALYHALAPFANRNINMMKIESRPIRGKPWQYRFHLDLQASTKDPEVQAAIAELRQLSAQLRILGSYQAAETAQVNSVSSTEKSR